eukprot:GHVN01081576.1.p1 GENE.GHVN01081576.1~~GHVN01081576.1.p1  ORF type:complete len:102 (+),score=7.54 GHVN01081576.1:467-772(+)
MVADTAWSSLMPQLEWSAGTNEDERVRRHPQAIEKIPNEEPDTLKLLKKFRTKSPLRYLVTQEEGLIDHCSRFVVTAPCQSTSSEIVVKVFRDHGEGSRLE